MNRLIIIGASGHGKVIADIARQCGYEDIAFLDDDEGIESCGGFPVIGKTNNVPEGDIFVAVGNAEIRERISKKNDRRSFPVLIHPKAVVADNVQLGSGTVVMAGVVINPNVRIGKSCIVNTSSSIDHDCTVGDYCHISVGAHLCGSVLVGNNTWIGAGAIVNNNISICENCTIGSGAVVIKPIIESGIYVGVPARKSR